MVDLRGGVRRRARQIVETYVLHRPPDIGRRLAAMAEIARRADRSLFAGNDLTAYEFKVFSQSGEDGVLVEILNRIGVTNRFFVEFGIQTGVEGNCVLLADLFGWTGLFIEADENDHAVLARKYSGTRVQALRDFVTADRFDEILTSAGVPDEPDVLSIDIDGNDLYVWRALTSFRPRVVIVEYNSGIPLDEPKAQVHRPGEGWNGTGGFGSSLAALEIVAREKGYRLVHTDLAGVNAFFVREDLASALAIERAPRRNQNFGLIGATHPPGEPEGGWSTIGD